MNAIQEVVSSLYDVVQSHPILVMVAIFYAYMYYQRTRPFPEVPGARVVSSPNLAEFQALLKPDSVTIVDFYATWCPPCRAAAPTFGKLSLEDSLSKVQFVKVNVDTARDIAREYKVSSMPTFILLNGREEVDRLTGWSEARLKAMLSPFSSVPSKHD